MAKTHDDQLELDQDIALERLTLTLQRIGWILLIVLLGLAALGLFGSGPLSPTVRSSEGGEVRVSYDRFERRLMDSVLRVRIASGNTIQFHRSYLEHAEIKGIEPPPSGVGSMGEEIAYSFANDSPGPFEVEFEIKLKNKPGVARGSVRAGDEIVPFWQMIFP